MRKRKQILAAALAGAMAFSLTACGKTNTAAGQTESIQQTESRGQAEPTEETADEANTASEENENGFLSSGILSGKDSMSVSVFGNEDRILLVARYDNLGKGASGAAVECLNYILGVDKVTDLEL